ncbi:uncharacterized protein LOC131934495, partial [Physella acuta]|uniref:uncharacterized protein LOC131934495 n=1 Tax=Physella acuta TaxID=109671 RepID=UPI0027DAC192
MAFNNYDHIFTTSTLCIIVIFLYLMSCCHSCDSGTCLEKSHSMVCTTGNEECSTPFVCRSDKNNINRCLCAVNNYYTSSTTSCTSDPAKPGKVYNVIQLPNTTTNGPYEYMIYFEASEGNVANYTFGVKNLTGLMTSSTPSVVSYELTPLKTYSYEIIAQNIVGYVSEKTIGSFSTPAE